MAKKNGLVDRIAQIRKETFFTTQHFTRQLVMDQAAIIKTKMDMALKQIYGDLFVPWEVRYGRS